MQNTVSGVRDSWRRRVAGLAQLATPLAVLALLAIAARLTIDARLAERSHRAAAESALRDYAGFASWQLSRQFAAHLRSHLTLSLAPVRDIPFAPGRPLPHPRVLSERGRECDCGFKGDITLAFRLDLRNGQLDTDRAVSDELGRDLAGWLPTAIERITSRTSGDRRPGAADENRDPLRQTSAIAFDTLGGRPLVVAYGLVLDQAYRPRALYGVASGLMHLADDYRRVLTAQPFLPPSLTAGLTSDSVLAVRVRHPAVGAIFTTDAAPAPDAPAHTDTLPSWLGGHVTTVAIRPEVAGTLLIGGIPPSRLPLQLTLLALAVALAVVALVQIRKTRELGRLRERFVANVSHELRTPLAQISMLSETLMLGRERSVGERHEFAAVVYREARRLTTLVESVLQFSRGRAATTSIAPQTRHVAPEVREGVEAFSSLARAAGATIVCRIPADLVMRSDPFAFRQVLLNLLDNAVKFGPHGQTIVIEASGQGGLIALSISDQGRGVPEPDRRRVFDAYTRGDVPGTTAVTGAGIGLSVVRDLVTAHGGTVRIDTPPGAIGTRVTFTMPSAA